MANNRVSVYVAGKWGHKPAIQTVQNELRKRGYLITHDWTKVEEADKKSPNECAKFAELDIDAVRRADNVLIVLTDPKYPYRGTCAELGAALATKTPVYIIVQCQIVPDFMKSIFAMHELVTVVKDVNQYIMYTTVLKEPKTI